MSAEASQQPFLAEGIETQSAKIDGFKIRRLDPGLLATASPLGRHKMTISNTTRREAETQLRELGIEGEALESILRETGALRHAGRVSRTLAAASSWCDGKDAPHADHEGCTWCLILLVADMIGVGGRDGCEGRATERLDVFEDLGTGRKQAMDGGAWMAALESAIAHHVQNGANVVSPGNVLVQLGEWPRWMRSVAREGLRRSLGLDPWHELEGVTFDGEPKEWAEVVNRAECGILEAEEE